MSKGVIIIFNRNSAVAIFSVVEPIIEFVFFLLIRIYFLFFFRFRLSKVIDILTTLFFLPVVARIIGVIKHRILSERCSGTDYSRSLGECPTVGWSCLLIECEELPREFMLLAQLAEYFSRINGILMRKPDFSNGTVR